MMYTSQSSSSPPTSSTQPTTTQKKRTVEARAPVKRKKAVVKRTLKNKFSEWRRMLEEKNVPLKKGDAVITKRLAEEKFSHS